MTRTRRRYTDTFKAEAVRLVVEDGLGVDKFDSALILNPSMDEQTAIANFLDRKTAAIDAKISKTRRIIELQKEYRTVLISEVVTGKIKIPELSTQETSVWRFYANGTCQPDLFRTAK